MLKHDFNPKKLIDDIVEAFPINDTKAHIYNTACHILFKERDHLINVILNQANKSQLIQIIKHLEKYDNINIEINDEE